MLLCILATLSAIPLAESTEPLFIDVNDDMDITEINQGLGLSEGDILRTRKRSARHASLDETRLWDIPVPYILDDSLDVNTKAVILQAFEHFRLRTCIDFEPRRSEEYFLSVRKNKGCSSYISKVVKNGQIVSLDDGCGHLGIVQHEFLHALGFNHEHSRYDRDDYITILWQNIKDEQKGNFEKTEPGEMPTFNVPYDYLSILHYGKKSFSKNGALTIATKLPQYQDRIGQRMGLSHRDAYKLNLLYSCNASVSFMMHCNFSDADACGMSGGEAGSATSWKRVSAAGGRPPTDYTDLDEMGGHFMHASTAGGPEGDSAWLETKRMSPTRRCHVQCLQFYYYHSGSQTDQLNIWIKDFQNETDQKGNLRHMGQIAGQPTFHWLFHTVSLNATKPFQVVFEVRRGKEDSSGGFSIDDINLSETECPQHVWQIQDFENLLRNSDYNTRLRSPRLYSDDGYAYQMVIGLKETFFGIHFRLVSGDHDSNLEWPCPWRQVTFVMLDKTPHIQQEMSHQINLITDPSSSAFDNPRLVGQLTKMADESIYVNPGYGYAYFASLEEIKDYNFLKGGTVVFLISMTDVSNLRHQSSQPCPKHPRSFPNKYDEGMNTVIDPR